MWIKKANSTFLIKRISRRLLNWRGVTLSGANSQASISPLLVVIQLCIKQVARHAKAFIAVTSNFLPPLLFLLAFVAFASADCGEWTFNTTVVRNRSQYPYGVCPSPRALVARAVKPTVNLSLKKTVKLLSSQCDIIKVDLFISVI